MELYLSQSICGYQSAHHYSRVVGFQRVIQFGQGKVTAPVGKLLWEYVTSKKSWQLPSNNLIFVFNMKFMDLLS